LKGPISRLDGEILQHLVDPFDDEAGLLRGAIILAGTSHVPEGAKIQLRLQESLSCFNGKDVGLARSVLLLERGQEGRGHLYPKETVHSRGNGFFAQESANSFDVSNSDLVDEIRFQNLEPPSRSG
jgi:hypothetical protein